MRFPSSLRLDSEPSRFAPSSLFVFLLCFVLLCCVPTLPLQLYQKIQFSCFSLWALCHFFCRCSAPNTPNTHTLHDTARLAAQVAAKCWNFFVAYFSAGSIFPGLCSTRRRLRFEVFSCILADTLAYEGTWRHGTDENRHAWPVPMVLEM